MSLLHPIFFEPNRVRRQYAGGMLLNRFLRVLPEEDDYFSEEWLASVNPAGGDSEVSSLNEGLSRTIESGGLTGPLLAELLDDQAEFLLGEEYIASHSRSLGIQAKLVDYAEKAQVCCLSHGEVWTILGTREVGGQPPAILLGFQEGVTAKLFAAAAKKKKPAALEEMLHSLPVQPGQTYFIPPHMPVMASAGLFMLKTQAADAAETLVAAAPDAFDVTAMSRDDLFCQAKQEGLVLRRSDEGYCAEVAGEDKTGSFAVWQAEIITRMQLSLPRPFALVVCVSGEGRINWAGGSRELRAGEAFIQPFGVPWIEYAASRKLSLHIILPPAT
ncbi:MAG: hypothetical protein K8S55_08950 [Phycisphaerae bacterium]|nr:hypothetical protein [Phycisphaerae bacterium]